MAPCRRAAERRDVRSGRSRLRAGRDRGRAGVLVAAAAGVRCDTLENRVRRPSLVRLARRRGLPVPEPVAALVDRRGLGYRGMLVMREIGDATPISALVDRGIDFDLARDLADSLRELHDAGLDHPDLNLGNVLLRAARS